MNGDSLRQAVRSVLREEDSTLAGKVVNLKDGAGLTRFGITSKNHPELIAIGFFSTMSTDQALAVAEQVFGNEYAKPLHIADVADLPLATALLSFGVNAGVSASARLLQTACCQFEMHLECDGIIGPSTLAAVRQINPTQLLATFSVLAKTHYGEVAERNPSKRRFLNGWNNRVDGWQKAG